MGSSQAWDRLCPNTSLGLSSPVAIGAFQEVKVTFVSPAAPSWELREGRWLCFPPLPQELLKKEPRKTLHRSGPCAKMRRRRGELQCRPRPRRGASALPRRRAPPQAPGTDAAQAGTREGSTLGYHSFKIFAQNAGEQGTEVLRISHCADVETFART